MERVHTRYRRSRVTKWLSAFIVIEEAMAVVVRVRRARLLSCMLESICKYNKLGYLVGKEKGIDS